MEVAFDDDGRVGAIPPAAGGADFPGDVGRGGGARRKKKKSLPAMVSDADGAPGVLPGVVKTAAR